MSLSRRKLLLSSLGAAQVSLLGPASFLSSRPARAAVSGRPTKLLCVYISGGLGHELMWAVSSDADVAKYAPAGNEGGVDATMLGNFDGTGGGGGSVGPRPLRGTVTWNWDNPSDGGNSGYNPVGYAWAAPEYRLFENTVVIHGIDQGTAAHYSGYVAAMCGIAGSNFAAPAIPSVVANHFSAQFADRPLQSVTIGVGPAPALTLPTAANPISLTSTADLRYSLSQDHAAWNGLKDRTDAPDVNFAGEVQDGTIPLTVVDKAVLDATRRFRNQSSAGTDVFLEGLYDQYRILSRTLARDVVSVLDATPGVEYLPAAMSWAPGESRFGWRVGLADFIASDNMYLTQYDLVLRLLKSDLCTAVSFKLPTGIFLDTHTQPHIDHRNHLRGSMEAIGRLLIEMKLTPSVSQPGKTLLDETLVYVFSEFGRTFSTPGHGNAGTDHYPMTSAVLVGGGIVGNQMFGGFAGGDPNGVPVAVTEESGDSGSRPLRAQDVAATIFTTMGMEMGADFFIPGGYGSVDGVLP